ncbi:MAG: aminoacyl-tRNA hydrolase [Candidatus Colwellbacteria bacterium]|nr:aminoacyl-tRNA hydrolase [Candidatus Colwellbacteria bacterium]
MDPNGKKEIRLIIGLGNPLPEYQKTYHNTGHLFIDYLNNEKVDFELLKTDVYMNQSGKYIRAALKKYGLRPEEVLVVHDDSDLPLGKFRFSFGRGSAGHQGAESVINSLGTKNFWRLRFGIRKQKGKAGEFILRPINAKDYLLLEEAFGASQRVIFGSLTR